ncbi:ABC transporter family protein [Histomonas meleagridis]|uniref:ABC transporter family protein n=1 Tax=Histomonas meleagridis TaxID=135588 RepID=UPI00355A8547|nr:ABC transporter family protein [Histomonas meleagridis]KAH0805376.1 ABC transporter family protein [Histomonas meleagridis]
MRRGPPMGFFRPHGSADEVTKKLTGREWLWLFRYMDNKLLYLLFVVLGAVSFSSMYVTSLIQGQLTTVLVGTDFDTPQEYTEATNSIITILLYATGGIFILHLLNDFVESKVAPEFLRSLKMSVLHSILYQDLSYYDYNQTGIILSRLEDDVNSVFDAYTFKLISLVRSIANFIFGLFICLYYSWKVTLIIMAMLPLFTICQNIGSTKIDDYWLEYNTCSTNVTTKSEEILTNFRTVKSFDMENTEYKEYKQTLNAVHEVIKKTSNAHGTKEFFNTIIHGLMSSVVLYTCGTMSYKKEIAPGSILNITNIIVGWSVSFSGIFSTFLDLKKANVSASKLLDILQLEPKIPLHEGRKIARVRGEIEFRNVKFSYPQREQNALDDLSFKINQGETVAIVGESGCGKSTTLLLMQRFYDAKEGEVLIDGINVKELEPISLRSHIAIVPQSPIMFKMSIEDNIRFGKPDASYEQVVRAARIANAHSFIVEMPKGYKTKVEQNSLSGGQKQRICLARAILVGAPILLLDEATAALDTESERLVQEGLQNYRVGKTAIVVAHRLATVKNASRILVMDKGKIVETGTHEELLQKSGFYAHLIAHQLQ